MQSIEKINFFLSFSSRVNLTPSPQASQQILNNGQKFYYQLQSSLTALSSPTSESVSKTNASTNSLSNNNNNSKNTSGYANNSELIDKF